MPNQAVTGETREEASLENPLRRRALRVGFGLILALLAVRFALFAVSIGFLIPIRLDLTFPEGAIVDRAWDVARGESAYHDWRVWPHSFAPYGPLAYYLVGWSARVLEWTDHAWDIYFLGRMQSCVALILLAVWVVAIGRALRLGWAWSFASVLLWCSWDQVFSYVASYRPDAPTVAFSMGALAMMMRRHPTRRAMVAVYLLLSLAMWFKPSVWGMILTAVIWSWGAGYRRAWGGLAGFIALNLILAGFINARMDGRLFLNMLKSLDNGFIWGSLALFYRNLRIETLAVFMAGGVAILSAFQAPASGGMGMGERPAGCARRLLMLAALAVWASSSIQNFKEGADVNYYLEPFVLLGLCAVCGLHDLFRSGRMGWPRTVAGMLGMMAWAVWGVVVWVNGYGGFLRSLRASWEETSSERYVAKEIQGDILTTSPFLALASPGGRAPLDHGQFEILVRRGLLDPSELMRRLEEQTFSAVIIVGSDSGKTPKKIFCPGFLETLNARYALDRKFGHLNVFRPSRREDPQ